MISSSEFQQTLQSGKIHQALALLVSDASELDITTRITEDSVTNDRTGNTEYLRTKINLLTGEIQNEISRDILANSTSYLKLQQLHHDRIVASDRIVQGYLSQLKAILASLPPIIERLPQAESSQLNTDALLARLTQAAVLLKDPIVSMPDSQLGDNLAGPDGDDLDLSIDLEGAVWEEWVEDEDFGTGSTLKPDWEENWVQRHLNPVETHAPNPRATESTTGSAHWDKFAPECINIDISPQPQTPNNDDVYR